MNDLTLIAPKLLPGALTTAEIDATMAYAAPDQALLPQDRFRSRQLQRPQHAKRLCHQRDSR